jgi:hypothetical protein
MSHKGKLERWAQGGQLERPQVQYPVAAIAYYGPDDRTPTKIAVLIVDQEGELVALEHWAGPEVTLDLAVMFHIQRFIERHHAKKVLMTDGIIGCPHEEGVDYPEGEDCPFCPFWRGRQ